MTLELHNKIFARPREVEEAFKTEGTARTKRRTYKSVVSGLQRYVRLGRDLVCQIQTFGLYPKAMGK